jgi:hypothetical protein
MNQMGVPKTLQRAGVPSLVRFGPFRSVPETATFDGGVCVSHTGHGRYERPWRRA